MAGLKGRRAQAAAHCAGRRCMLLLNDSRTCSRPDVSQVVSLVLPQLGELQIGNLALKELLVPQLTQFMIAIQNGLG